MAATATEGMDLPEEFEDIVDQLHDSANARTVFGEAIERGGRTIIPVARVAYGFGGGLGSGPEEGDEGETAGGSGLGFGGGAMARPVGALEVSDRETRFVPLSSMRDRVMAVGAFLAGLALGRMLARGGSRGE